jgi:hypothetical protein
MPSCHQRTEEVSNQMLRDFSCDFLRVPFGFCEENILLILIPVTQEMSILNVEFLNHNSARD